MFHSMIYHSSMVHISYYHILTLLLLALEVDVTDSNIKSLSGFDKIGLK